MVYAMDGSFRVYALAIQPWTVPLVVSVIQRIKFRHGRYKKYKETPENALNGLTPFFSIIFLLVQTTYGESLVMI